MRSRITLSILSACVLLAVVASIWMWRLSQDSHHFTPPFVELRFYDSGNPRKLVYTLYLARTNDSTVITAAEPSLTLKRLGKVVEASGAGTARYKGKAISYFGSTVSIDGKDLPPTPSYSVLTAEGKVIIGAFIRTFD